MSNLSEKILQYTIPYLGPASKIFLERETSSHMEGLKFDEIKLEHLPELLKRIYISSGPLVGAKADELVKRLEILLCVKRNT